MERFGFVGLPNAGKSSLYNALAGGGALAAPYAFATTDPNVGVAEVPDARLDAPRRHVGQSQKSCTPPCSSSTSAGWSRGRARARVSATGSWRTSARSTPSCTCCGRSTTPTCPVRPTRSSTSGAWSSSCCLADLETVEKQLGAQAQAGASSTSRSRPRWRRSSAAYAMPRRGHAALPVSGLAEPTASVLRAALPAHQPARARRRQHRRGPARRRRRGRRAGPGRARRARRRCWRCACSSRPRRRSSTPTTAPRCSRRSGSARARCRGSCRPPTTCSACARSSPPATRRARAWTFRAGSKAPECAGVIHTDLQRGFIRAEVIHWDELLDIGSWTKAKDVGKLRVEGKDYEVQDGDVLEIRFNV